MDCTDKEKPIKKALRDKGITDAMEGCGYIPEIPAWQTFDLWYGNGMNGRIKFFDLKQLADFLKEFTDSTAVFEVWQEQNTGRWILEFSGGH